MTPPLEMADNSHEVIRSHAEKITDHDRRLLTLEKDMAVLASNQTAFNAAHELTKSTIHKIEIAIVRMESAQDQYAKRLDTHIESLKALINEAAKASRIQLYEHENKEFQMQRDMQKTANKNQAIMTTAVLASTLVAVFWLFIMLFRWYVTRGL